MLGTRGALVRISLEHSAVVCLAKSVRQPFGARGQRTGHRDQQCPHPVASNDPPLFRDNEGAACFLTISNLVKSEVPHGAVTN